MKKLLVVVSLFAVLQMLWSCGGGGGNHEAPPQSKDRELFVAGEGSVSVYDPAIDSKGAFLRKFGDLTDIGTGDGMALDNLNNELFLCNLWENSITVYKRTANGNVSPLRTIFGSLTTLIDPHGIAVDPVHNEIFVLSEYSIVVFRRDADGNVAPLRTIAGDGTGLNDAGATGIAVDPVNNEIFITSAGIFDWSVRVYSRTANGNVAPMRIISGDSTGLANSYSIVVDTENNEIFVSNASNNSITVYDRTANGNVTPIRTVHGENTGLKDPFCVALDPQNNEILAINNDSMTVYARQANGNVVPLRTLSVDLAPNGAAFSDIAVDVKNNELVISKVDSINVYSRSANGNMLPIRTIKGREAALSSVIAATNNEIFMPDPPVSVAVYKRAANGSGTTSVRTFSDFEDTHLSGIEKIAVNTLKKEIFILNGDIFVYERTTSGKVSPLRTISVSVLPGYGRDMSLDLVNDEVFVTENDFPDCYKFNACEGVRNVTVFSSTAGADAKPLRIISGSYTGLDPQGIAVDTVNNEIFVLNRFSISVFERDADGNAAPLRTISGDLTGLNVPSQWKSAGIEVDSLNNEVFVLNGDNSILVFPRTANGNVPPIRTIFVSNSSRSSYGIALLLK